jgi:hypothetical protein
VALLLPDLVHCALGYAAILPADRERMQRATMTEVTNYACRASQHDASRYGQLLPEFRDSCAWPRISLSFSCSNEKLRINFIHSPVQISLLALRNLHEGLACKMLRSLQAISPDLNKCSQD